MRRNIRIVVDSDSVATPPMRVELLVNLRIPCTRHLAVAVTATIQEQQNGYRRLSASFGMAIMRGFCCCGLVTQWCKITFYSGISGTKEKKMPKIPEYTKEALDEALEKINTKAMSSRAVAKKYNIPRATLQFKLKNPNSKPRFGPTPYLTNEEETTIAEWSLHSSKTPRTYAR
ncbi:hypothetical protein EVAR_46121_1 [Eumeta japonica]|uniref:HTH psq-type domain-containing protein n=1 Tax=Eumeta variegata TaxID=151549 RepID=A0A4C1XTT6_EUMVA|nr:hypothetical protein EVAR_46121_1 [Eumeta japonica]